MRMMDELKPLFLYSANKKVYAPIDEKDKRRNSAILLLTPSLEISNRLMNLPYIHNPDLFVSYYMDRNIMAYIDNVDIEKIEFDEKEEEALSEAMQKGWDKKIKFKCDDNVSITDRSYIEPIFNSNITPYLKILRINSIPTEIKVHVYPTVTALREGAPKPILNFYKDNLYSYSEKNNIHLISRLNYDPIVMGGTYEMYIITELLYCIIMQYNPKCNSTVVRGIASSYSGRTTWIKNNYNTISKTNSDIFSKIINRIIKQKKDDIVYKYIVSADIMVFADYDRTNMTNFVKSIVYKESTLTYSERQRLLPSEFGLPSKRAYPMHDEEHVRLAIKMFNQCDTNDEEELAEAIKNKIKKFGLEDIKVSASNRFRKYYAPQTSKKENTLLEVSLNDFESDILSKDNNHPEYSDSLRNVNFDGSSYGEIFKDEDDNLIAFYMTEKKDDGFIWITSIGVSSKYKNNKSFLSQLFSRIYDRQDATHIAVSKYEYENGYLKKFYDKNFEVYDETKDAYLMRIEESAPVSFENTDYGDIMKICSHLSNDELKRITFYDTYRDSKFVIKRIIKRVGSHPAGFLDVYQFPSKPEIAQIVIAVDPNYRDQHIADSMVKELIESDLHDKYSFDMYYWTAHPENIASQNLAIKNGFENTNSIDKYGRYVFIKIMNTPYSPLKEFSLDYDNGFTITENALITGNMGIFYEVDNKQYSKKLKQYLYNERIKNNKGTLEVYEKIKTMNPNIKKMYVKIKMYKKQNLFVDLYYYNALFLQNNYLKSDKAINLYFEFLNRLINNTEIDSEYSKKTIFIPVDNDSWTIEPGTDLFDFKKNLNPISIIFRLIRTNLPALRKEWGNKSIVFVGSRGYFTVDFNSFDVKDLPRFKTNLRKLRSSNELIEDDYEKDILSDDTEDEAPNKDSSKAMANKMINKIEFGSSIKVNDVSGTSTTSATRSRSIPHLQISKEPLLSISDEDSIAIVSIDPDGYKGFSKQDSNKVIANITKVDAYCIPK